MKLVRHTVVCAQEPLTAVVLAKLLNISSESLVRATLSPLVSVLSVLSIDEMSGVFTT
jgi:hypothetical protein